MPDIVDFPTGLVITDRTDPMLMPRNRSGGPSINGFEQIISPLSLQWEWSVTIPVFAAHQERALRILLAKTKGRLNYVRVRLCDQYRMSRRYMGAVDSEVTHSDGAPFSDESTYALSGGTTPVGVNLEAGASSVVVDAGFVPLPGTFFSINYWLYLITAVDDPADGDPPTQRTMHFEPQLRDAAGSDDEIDFDAVALWRLASDGEGRSGLQLGRFGTVQLNFVEPINR